MPIEWSIRECPIAPIDSVPEISGLSRDGYLNVLGATAHFADDVDRVTADLKAGLLGPAGAVAQIRKLREGRETQLAAAEHQRKADAAKIADLAAEVRKDSEIDVPPPADRVSLIVATYQAFDKSARFQVIREGDNETCRALCNAPRILNLLSDTEREIIEDRLLGAVGDGSRAKELKARKIGLGQLTYAIDTGRAWLDRKAGIQATVRERIERARERS
jgi:hypothetical protein